METEVTQATEVKRPKYLGETLVDQENSPYKGYTAAQWALEYHYRYGQIDGEHHKQWVLDQMARILLGVPIILKLAKWDDGQEEYRFTTGKQSRCYKNFVRRCKRGGYSYEKGIAP